MTRSLLFLGMGYSARAIARRAKGCGWSLAGTTRSPEKARALHADGITPFIFAGDQASDDLKAAIRTADAIVVSIAPGEGGDPVLRHFGDDFRPGVPVSYLSTVGVYGDHGGAWVDETTVPRPVSQRSRWRIAAERQWQEAASRRGFFCDIFRLAGIYGPGRNPFIKLMRGEARALVKPGQVFNRIHVADIAAAVHAGLSDEGKPGETRIFNVSDDEPAPPQDVVWHAADLARLPRPAPVDFVTADLSPMARSFYGECKRVGNARMKQELCPRLIFPTYREGLGAIWASGETDSAPMALHKAAISSGRDKR